MRTHTRWIAPVLAAVLAACADGMGTQPEPARPVASVAVTPGDTTLPVGAQHTLAAIPRAGDGTVLSGRAVTWISSDPDVAQVSADGVVTARAEGLAIVTAKVETKAGSVTVQVFAAVDRIEVGPAAALSLMPGQDADVTARALAADGAVLTRTIAWTTSNAGVATVSAAGKVTAVGPGTAVVTAAAGGKHADVNVTVVAPVVVGRVELNHAAQELATGETAPLAATVYSTTGAVIERGVTWSSSNPAAATVSATGVVTAVGAGTTTISAEVEGKRATATVRVGTWISHALLAVGDSALPAAVYATATYRYQATAGVLRLLSTGGRYEIDLNGWLLFPRAPGTQGMRGYSGVVLYDVFNGQMLFVRALNAPNADFRAVAGPDGRITVTGVFEPGTAAASLTFAP